MKLHVIATGSKGNCYVVDDGSRQLILECGVSIKRIKQALSFNFSRVDGCLVTHSHNDHCKAVGDLCECGVNVYTSHGTADEIGLRTYRVKRIKESLLYIADNNVWTFKAFAVKHDTEEPFGYYVYNYALNERFVFLTDSAYSPYTFPNLDYLFVECNHDYDSLDESCAIGDITAAHRLRVMQNHFSLENCVEFVKECKKRSDRLRKIVLLHSSDVNADVNKIIKTIQGETGIATEMATAGATINL